MTGPDGATAAGGAEPASPACELARPVADLPVWAIVGPTASGKSSAAMRLAVHATELSVTGQRPVEVVAVDAFTIYRGLEITTAMPTAADRAAVPHHLVGILPPTQQVSVAQFQAWARDAIAEVHRRGHVPLLVGGSGLYFRAVVDDLDFPPTDPEVRDRVRQRWGDDPRSAHDHLTTVDADAAALIEPDNLRRTVRALEVIELTGRQFSSYRTDFDTFESDLDLHVDYLEPPTAVLRERIAARTAAMLDAGMVAEVAALDVEELSRTARQAIGVAEVVAVQQGDASRDDLAEAIATRTWHYARRQRSWFRKDPRCAASRHDSADALAQAHLATRPTRPSSRPSSRPKASR